MNVDRVLRESTRALTFTLPNSVTDAFGIFSVSSRSRSAEGFHSTDAAFTCCPTVAPPPGRGRALPGSCQPSGTLVCALRCEIRGVYPARPKRMQAGCQLRGGSHHDRPAGRTKRCARYPAYPDRAGGGRCGKLSLVASENERKRPGERASTAHSARLGLDLWFTPLAVIHRWSRAGPLGANLLHLAQYAAQRAEPGVLMFPDQAHAPGERVTAAAGHPGLDERVEHPALGLAQ